MKATCCASALALAAGLASAQTAPPTRKVEQITLLCDATYLPARTNWTRTVVIGIDDQRVRQVSIDGVPVHTFVIADTVILTSIDNELSWTSDFRGLASGQGRCMKG
jgi:hypothetical protein